MEGRMGVGRRGKTGRNNENENERTKERKKPKGSEGWIRQEGRTKKKKGTKEMKYRAEEREIQTHRRRYYAALYDGSHTTLVHDTRKRT
jgi:hypothetical protein